MKHELPEDSPAVQWTTSDGKALTLRHVRGEDVGNLISFVRGLSFGARYFRYGHGDIEFSKDEILLVCNPDPHECVHLLVLKVENGKETVIGSGRIVFEAGGASCEVAIAVTDAWQGRGVGKQLMEALFESARRRGLKEMHAQTLASNRRMIAFLRGRGFTVSDGAEGAAVKLASIAL
jgi:acetyltransferase